MQRSKIEDIFVAGTMAEQFLSVMEGKKVPSKAGKLSTSQSSAEEVHSLALADALPAVGGKAHVGPTSPKKVQGDIASLPNPGLSAPGLCAS